MIVFVWMENYPLPQTEGNTHPCICIHKYTHTHSHTHTHTHTPQTGLHTCTKLPMKSPVFFQTVLKYAVSQEVSKETAQNRSEGSGPESLHEWKVWVAQSCLTLCDPMDCSLRGSSVHGISRQEYWSGLLCLSPADLPDPGTEPRSLELQVDSLPSEAPEKLYTLPLCHLSPQTSQNQANTAQSN